MRDSKGETCMSGPDNYWKRKVTGQGYSRRRVLGGAGVAAAGLGALGLVGCGDDDDDTEPTDTNSKPAGSVAADSTSTPMPSVVATQAPKKGGVWNTGQTGTISGFSPFTNNYNGVSVYMRVANYLIVKNLFAPEAGTIYDLASAHKVAADGVTWTFTLRPDAKIGPNKFGIPERAVDAEDVKASFDYIATKANGANAFQPFNDYFEKWEAPDKTTIRLVTKKPYAFTEDVIAHHVYCPILPKELVAKGADAMKTEIAGGGAWVMKEAIEGQSWRIEPNPNYWDKGKPYLEAMVGKQFADQVTYRTAFQSGQIDSYAPPNAEEAADLVKSEKGLIRNSNPSLNYLSFWMNLKNKPWSDGRVRRAVNMATNRQEYIDIIGKGVGEPIGPLTYAYKAEALPKDELAKLQPFDVAGAKKLFAEAGVTEFEFQYPTSSVTGDYVTIFQRQMQAAGVTVKPEPLDAGTWYGQYAASTLTASLSLNQQYVTPDLALGWYRTNGITGNNRFDTGFSDAEVDAALAKASSTTDATARSAAYLDVQRLLYKKDLPFFNFFGARAESVHRPFIMNYPVSGAANIDGYHAKNVWINKV